MTQTVQVVGGGVAGLAVARAAALRGFAVELREQATEIAEVGAGLQLSPNGMRVLDALGLGEAVRARGQAAEAVELRDGLTGRRVLRMDLARASGPYICTHRARLIDVLENGAHEAGVSVTLGTRAEPGETPVLAADGLHSAHRARLNGDREPFFTGQVAWRAVIPDPGAAPVVQVFMGPGRHLVSYPIGDDRRNIVAVEERPDWAAEGWHHEDDPSTLAAAFDGFRGPVPDWLARVERVHLWGLFRHPVAEVWERDGTALLGDAAHPTLPFLAQGANMALEDACVLAACLERGDLAAYQRLRRDRVVRIVAAAEANARNYHLAGFKKRAGHAVLRAAGTLAPQATLRRFDWLYGYDATKESI